MSKFSEQVHITIEGFSQNVIYYNLELSQKMADHHHFSFFWQYTGKPIIAPQDQEKAFSSYMGSEVIFTFKVKGIRLMSKGRITKLSSVDLNGSPAGLHVTGTSNTIAIDDMPKSRIFHEKNLQQIGIEIFGEESSGEFYQRDSIVPTYTKEFKCKTQYNETSFNFLKRLSARYAQWFYYDGMRMQFGKIKNTEIRLINESSMHHFSIEAKLVSHKTSFSGYDYNYASAIKNGSEKTAEGSQDRFASLAVFKQPYIVRPGLGNGAYTGNAQNKDEIDEMVKMQTAASDANSIFYSGTSYLPIGLGQTFYIENKNVEHHLLAVEITHRSEVNGNYTCLFKAIPADVAAPHYTDVTAFAPAESQPARVIDNNDPEKMGRIKVEFFWSGWSSKSGWMRVVQQYSGKNWGQYNRPEIDDEVLVSFENGNVERPYVSGSHYNGKAMPEYFDEKNNIKALKTRSGIETLSNDAQGSWKQSTPDGNYLFFDGEGNATLNIQKNLNINVGENLNINVGKNMENNVIASKNDTVGLNHTEKIGGIKELGVTGDFNAAIGGKYLEHIQGDFESHTEKDRHENSKENFTNSSEKDINKNAQNKIQNNSGEQTQQN